MKNALIAWGLIGLAVAIAFWFIIGFTVWEWDPSWWTPETRTITAVGYVATMVWLWVRQS